MEYSAHIVVGSGCSRGGGLWPVEYRKKMRASANTRRETQTASFKKQKVRTLLKSTRTSSAPAGTACLPRPEGNLSTRGRVLPIEARDARIRPVVRILRRPRSPYPKGLPFSAIDLLQDLRRSASRRISTICSSVDRDSLSSARR